MKEENFPGWPDSWPSPAVFLGSLAADIAFLRCVSARLEHQVIIRFKNQYGVRISQHFLHDGLYAVSFLRFFGPNLDKYRTVKDSYIQETTWCFTDSEVLAVCDKVARWGRLTAAS